MWLRATFEAGAATPLGVDAATWYALRARAALLPARRDGAKRSLAVEACEAGLERRLDRPRVALYSPSGRSSSKIIAFVFDGQGTEPCAVVKISPDPVMSHRLAHETDVVGRLRDNADLAASVTAALPLAPLLAARLRRELVVVEPTDPMASATGLATRESAMAWLIQMQQGTSVSASWSADDSGRLLARLREGWTSLRPGRAEAVCARATGVLGSLEGAHAWRCTAHGDFWRGNLAQRGERLRVYDWEWSDPAGWPFYDLCSWELGELRVRAGGGDHALGAPARGAVARVENQLAARGLAPAFALPAMCSTLADQASRMARVLGIERDPDHTFVPVMATLEGIVLDR